MPEEHDELEDLIGIEERSRDKECCRCHRLYPVNFGDYVTNYCEDCQIYYRGLDDDQPL